MDDPFSSPYRRNFEVDFFGLFQKNGLYLAYFLIFPSGAVWLAVGLLVLMSELTAGQGVS